jgi:hypothetical protein
MTVREMVPAARAELAKKTCAEIESDTAVTWAARAVAAFELYRQSGKLETFSVAIIFENEALEHAANGPEGTLPRIKDELRALKKEVLGT